MSVRPLRTALLLAFAASACVPARPTGDFGRPRPSVIHDDYLPSRGRTLAEQRGEPVSDFNLTDTEEELRDRAWNFIRSPHPADQWLNQQVEGERTRVLPAVDPDFNPSRYYAALREDPYRSSEGRWSRVIEDIQADAMLIPPFCAVAAKVRRADVERIAAAERQDSADPGFVQEAYDRVEENNSVMAWVWRAVEFRLRAYRFAIDRLEVETPSDQLYAARKAWTALAVTRCEEAPAMRSLPQRSRPGRVYRGPDPFDQPVLQK